MAFVVGISGGSGAPYALRLIEALLEGGHAVKVIVSPAGEKVLELECGVRLSGEAMEKQESLRRALRSERPELPLEMFEHRNLAAPISSGSYPVDGVVVVPCSMGTMGRIANGISSDLISRVADVALKERRRLILVPRETPLSAIHLRNMLTATRAGATVLPAMPAFYHKPQSIGDMVDMIVSRILDHLGVENDMFKRWRGEGVSKFLALDDD